MLKMLENNYLRDGLNMDLTELIKKLKVIAKEGQTAKVYFKTGEIVGCKKGSFIYWHEHAHYLQSQNKFIDEFMTTINFAIIILVGWVMDAWEIVLILPLVFLALEIHAWIYSFYKLFKGEVIWEK